MKAGVDFFKLSNNQLRILFEFKGLINYKKYKETFNTDISHFINVDEYFNFFGYDVPDMFVVNSIRIEHIYGGQIWTNFNITYKLSDSINISFNYIISYINKGKQEERVYKNFNDRNFFIFKRSNKNSSFEFKYDIKSNSLIDELNKLSEYYNNYFNAFNYFIDNFYYSQNYNKIINYWCCDEIIPSFNVIKRDVFIKDYIGLYKYNVSIDDFIGLSTYRWFNIPESDDTYNEIINLYNINCPYDANILLKTTLDKFKKMLQKYKDFKIKLDSLQNEYNIMINDFCEKNNISKDMLDFKIKYTEYPENIKKEFLEI